MQEQTVIVHESVAGSTPFVVSSPHSGRNYPAQFVSQSKLNAHDLRRSEDAFVDELVIGATAHGAPVVTALFPRAYVDVNRDARELDPAMFDAPLPENVVHASPRVACGLGVIPRIVSEQHAIYRGKLTLADAVERINSCYVPYHRTIGELMRRQHELHGHAVLIDCHSMPSRSWGNKPWPDFILGDRFGASCSPDLAIMATEILRGLGYKVAKNKPYAGGYITERYGKPASGFHALQIEINRALYIDEARLEKHRGFELLRRDLEQFFARLVGAGESLIAQGRRPEAAE